jgi:hypothetical protein
VGLIPARVLPKRQSGIEVDTKGSSQQFLLDDRIFFQGMEDPPKAAGRDQALDGGGVGRAPAPVPHEQLSILITNGRPLSIYPVREQSGVSGAVAINELMQAFLND